MVRQAFFLTLGRVVDNEKPHLLNLEAVVIFGDTTYPTDFWGRVVDNEKSHLLNLGGRVVDNEKPHILNLGEVVILQGYLLSY